MRVDRAKIFVPVVTIMPLADETEALEPANETLFGLTVRAWTVTGECKRPRMKSSQPSHQLRPPELS